jgi:hypothetical protein
MSDEIKVEVELVETRFKRLWRLRDCPLCGEEHRHSAGKLDEDPRSFLGPVTGHCRPGTKGAPIGYTLVEKT